MPQLTTFTLPLSLHGPPNGYTWEDRDVSTQSRTSAFDTGIDQRDIFLGLRRCVICGSSSRAALDHCHIIGQSEPEIWSTLRARNWLPPQAKQTPQHEPRNGLLMCATHHRVFDAYDFFIRFFPTDSKFVLVNYSRDPSLQRYHGKAIALDNRDRCAPFPSLFILHETRVRGFHPFEPIAPDIPSDIPWQDWSLSDGVFDSASGSFKRRGPPEDHNSSISGQPQLQPQPAMTSGGATSSRTRTLALNDSVIAEILAATRASPSWKACQIEGTSWTGTAEENIQKYVSSIGVDESQLNDLGDF